MDKLEYLNGDYEDQLGIVPESEYDEEKVLGLTKRIFSLDLKPNQLQCIKKLIEGRDVLIIASTGFGKSLIFQVPPLYTGKTAIVISPLIALMHDQVIALNSRGIKSTHVNITQNDRDIYKRFFEFKIFYITPESLVNNEKRFKFFKEHEDKISLFAIDEAHLIKTWSTFRRDFQSLDLLKYHFPDKPVVALTATSPPFVTNYILNILKLKNPFTIKMALNRPNIHLGFRKVHGGENTMVVEKNFHEDIIKELNSLPIRMEGGIKRLEGGSVILYVLTQVLSEQISRFLCKEGFLAMEYHGGSRNKRRETVITNFKDGTIDIVVCTVAFGMGIDRGDVRRVYHFGMPFTIESYYQEVGRAGRDGKPSRGIVFYTDKCIGKNSLQLFLITSNETLTKAEKDEQKNGLEGMVNFITNTTCRRKYLLTKLNDGQIEGELDQDVCCDRCDGKKILNASLEKRKNVEKTLDVLRKKYKGCLN